MINLILTLLFVLPKEAISSELIDTAQRLAASYNCSEAVHILQPHIWDESIKDEAMGVVADCLYKLGEYQKVIDITKPFLEKNPLQFVPRYKYVQSIIALNQNAEGEIQEIIKYHNTKKDVFLLAADYYFKKNQFNKVIEVLSGFQKNNKDSGEIHYLLAKTYYEMNLNTFARKEVDLALKLGPITSDLYLFLANLEKRELKLNEAIASIEYAIKLEPQKALSYLELSKIYVNQGRYLKARNFLFNAQDKVTKPEQYLLIEELAYLNILDDQFEAARQLLKRSIALAPRSERSHYLFVQSYIRQSNWASASLYLDNIIKKYPSRNWPVLAKARLLKKNSGDFIMLVYQHLNHSENPQELKNFLNNLVERSPASSTQYIEVKFGDTLSLIARKHFGKTSLWKQIFEWNKDVLISPHKLSVGLKLKLLGAP